VFTENAGDEEVPTRKLPHTCNFDAGVDVPTPTLPPLVTETPSSPPSPESQLEPSAMFAAVPESVSVEVAVSALKVAVPENAGEAENTRRFVPVSLVIDDARRDDAAVVVARLDASKNNALEAVWPENVIVEEAVSALNVAVPENAGAFEKTRRPEPVSSVSEDAKSDEAAVVVALLCASTKSALLAVWFVSLRIPVMVVEESVGAVPKTKTPEPVSLVIDDARSEDAAVVVALLCASTKSARDAVWLESFKILVIVVEESVGAVPKTSTPLPVSSETAEIRFAEVRPLASSEATFDEYEKKPWSPLAIMLAEREFASTVQVVPLQVNEPKSVACSSVGPTDDPKDERPSVEVATHLWPVAVDWRT
jgi:hypothetical protein